VRDPGKHAVGRRNISPKIEEVVVDADALTLQHVLPNRAQQLTCGLD
jgi:hypothetical protein